jgi:uncharacterized protein YjiS (DUF1127 family)
MEAIMKPMGIAALSQIADMHPASAFAPTLPGARPRPSLWQRILTWQRVARERRRLLELDANILKDIGLLPEEAYREASRPFWDFESRRR